jgi:hypothetical protein
MRRVFVGNFVSTGLGAVLAVSTTLSGFLRLFVRRGRLVRMRHALTTRAGFSLKSRNHLVNHLGEHDRDLILPSKGRLRVGLGILRYEARKVFLRLELHHLMHREGFLGPVFDLEALGVISSPLIEGVGALDVHEVGSYIFLKGKIPTSL